MKAFIFLTWHLITCYNEIRKNKFLRSCYTFVHVLGFIISTPEPASGCHVKRSPDNEYIGIFEFLNIG